MTAQEIINRFELWVDDNTELSSSDELDLLNEVYIDVWTDRAWEFSRKSFSSSINGTTISLPSNFSYITENARYTDNQSNNLIENQKPRLVLIGENKYKVVDYATRKQYDNKSGYCWVDILNNNLVFSTSVNGTVEYDYIYFPDPLTLTDTPLFPERFHPVLYHLMAVSDYAIQQFDKAKSYAIENQIKADHWLSKLRMWNANLLNG